jgi:hypothetical protein
VTVESTLAFYPEQRAFEVWEWAEKRVVELYRPP